MAGEGPEAVATNVHSGLARLEKEEYRYTSRRLPSRDGYRLGERMIAAPPTRRRQCRYGATCYQRNPTHMPRRLPRAYQEAFRAAFSDRHRARVDGA